MNMRINTILLALVAILCVGTVAAANDDHGHDHGDDHAHPGESTLKISVEPASLAPNVAAAMTLRIQDAAGSPVTLDKLKEVHTEKIHLLLVDPSLTDYHHVHPTPGQKDGEYVFSFTPKMPGTYKVFADLVPLATKAQEYAEAEVVVAGAAQTVEKTVNHEVTLGGLHFVLSFEHPDLTAGEANLMTLKITDKDSKPFTGLHPLMGAFAHVVAFDEERAHIAHVHPMGEEPSAPTQRGGPELQFHLNFAEPGYQKLFVQVLLDGGELYAPFGLKVGADEEEHSHDGVAVPETVSELLGKLDELVVAMDVALSQGPLIKAHEHAFSIKGLAEALPGMLGELDAATSTDLATINKRIGRYAALLDNYGHEDKLQQSKTVAGKLKTELDALKKLAAGQKLPPQPKDAANKVCPVTGAEVGSMVKDAHIDFGGYRVGLCCPACVEKFMDAPDEALGRALADGQKVG